MAILSGPAIKAAVAAGDIVIRPFNPNLVNANSVDVHLGDKLMRYSPAPGRRLRMNSRPPKKGRRPLVVRGIIDSRNPPPLVEVPLVDEVMPRLPGIRGTWRKLEEPGWILEPGVLYIGHTKEYTETRGYVPKIDGRSTTGRLGIFTHVTAGFGDNGFTGHWTLEITVVEPVLVYPGQRLCQLHFETIEGEQAFYGETGNTSGRYQGQDDPTAARVEDPTP